MQEKLITKDKVCISGNQVKTGIDLVYIADINEFLDSPIGIVVTQDEWTNIVGLPDTLQRLAGKFACKEAVMKVLGRGIDEIDFVDIEILNDDFGKPQVYLAESALNYWKQTGFIQLDVSITHHKDYALAVAVAIT